jgi:flagellar basal body-associated protein FliL
MDNKEKNVSSIIAFALVVLIIAFGGYYLVTKYHYSKSDSKEYVNESTHEDIRIDPNKDYIYFNNETVVSENLNIVYKDITININNDDAKKIETNLNNNMTNVRNSVVKIDLDKKGEYETEDDVYSANVIEYNVFKSSKYLSLIASKYSYTVLNGNSVKDNEYYVFDLSNGSILNNNDIMKKENVTDQAIRSKIRGYISNDTEADIDATLNNPYYLTIANNGNVVINFVVKTNSLNYNVSIEMD